VHVDPVNPKSYKRVYTNVGAVNFACRVTERTFRTISKETLQLNADAGRAITQAVSRRLPTATARVQSRVWSCGIFVMDKSGAGAGFLRELRFPLTITFHLLLHSHLDYHPRLSQ
jgi:hypothetical protein